MKGLRRTASQLSCDDPECLVLGGLDDFDVGVRKPGLPARATIVDDATDVSEIQLRQLLFLPSPF